MLCVPRACLSIRIVDRNCNDDNAKSNTQNELHGIFGIFDIPCRSGRECGHAVSHSHRIQINLARTTNRSWVSIRSREFVCMVEGNGTGGRQYSTITIYFVESGTFVCEHAPIGA